MLSTRYLTPALLLFTFIYTTARTESIATRLDSVYITGTTPFEVGKALGEYERDSIARLFAEDPLLLNVLRPWKAAHEAEYATFVATNRARFPRYFEEIEGIAQGAGVSESDLVLTALGPEIETLQGHDTGGNCFDAIGNPPSGPLVGHNEDLGPVYKSYSFLATIHQPYVDSDTAHTITAFAYPGAQLGFTFGWNSRGLMVSCNGIYPAPNPAGLGRYFVNRYILESSSVEDALERLTLLKKDLALGFATTLADARSTRVVNVEMGPDVMSIVDVGEGESLLHCNMYSHNDTVHVFNNFAQTSTNRLARAQELREPMTLRDIVDVLGDTKDPVFPIYRNGKKPDFLSTAATVLFDVAKARVEIYGGNPKFTYPTAVFSFDPIEEVVVGEKTENIVKGNICDQNGICN